MKTRFLIFLAAMLLGSASAFAQSGNNEPLKGDVNEDGTVDVADIAAIIKIMKDGGGTSEETAYYWVGTTQPTASNISSLTPKYSSLSDMNGKTLSVSAGQTVYLVCKTGSLSETSRKKGNLVMPDQSRTKFNKDIDTTTISGHSIYHSDAAGTAQTFTFDFDEELQTVYYWYVGPTTPTTVDIANIKTSETEIGWHKIEGNPTSIHIGGVSNSTKVNWVVLIPTKFNITKVSNGDDVTDAYTVSTTIIDGVEYRKWVQIQPTKQFDYDMIQQTQNQQYYTYIGPDASFKIVDEDGNLKPNAATNIESMPGVKTSTTLPKSLNDSYPIGTEIKGAEIGNDYVYIIGLASLFNKTTYLVAPTGSPIMMDDLGTFTKDSNIYKVLSTRGPVSTVIVQ